MIDYTKSISATQKNYDEGLRSYLLGIYNYMGLALLLTGVAAYATLSFPPLTNLMFNVGQNGQMGVTGLGMVVQFAPIGIALYFFTGMGRMTVKTAQLLFWVYAALTGMSLSSLGLVYTGESIARTFFICASVFGAMSIYGYTTKRDLTAIGSFLVMGLFGLVVVSLVNMFLQSQAVSFATSLIGIAVFIGLIAWDTQKLKGMYYAYAGSGEMAQKTAVMGAFILYLDFINLFLHMLRFFGNRRD